MFENDIERNLSQTQILTKSQQKVAVQYTAGFIPLTICRCLESDTRSSIKIITKLAGTNDMANITHVDMMMSVFVDVLKITN